MASKRHNNNKLTKRQKGGANDEDISNIKSGIIEKITPGPGLKDAWILFGISSIYILSKLLTNN
jgi:hypothetical protein